MNPIYCVTGRNRLTGEREIISKRLSKDQALQVKLDYTNVKGTRKPYTHAKVEIWSPQLEISFKK